MEIILNNRRLLVPDWWSTTVTEELIKEMSGAPESPDIPASIRGLCGAGKPLHLACVVHDVEWFFYQCPIEHLMVEPPSGARFARNVLQVMCMNPDRLIRIGALKRAFLDHGVGSQQQQQE